MTEEGKDILKTFTINSLDEIDKVAEDFIQYISESDLESNIFADKAVSSDKKVNPSFCGVFKNLFLFCRGYETRNHFNSNGIGLKPLFRRLKMLHCKNRCRNKNCALL